MAKSVTATEASPPALSPCPELRDGAGGGPAALTLTTALPVRELLCLSVALTVRLPAVFSVTVKVWLPASARVKV